MGDELTGYNTPTLVDDEERENPLRAPGHAAETMGGANAADRALRTASETIIGVLVLRHLPSG